MSVYEIELREAQREAFCRGCDRAIPKGRKMVATYSFRNRGQHIFFCLDCCMTIGQLGKVGQMSYLKEAS